MKTQTPCPFCCCVLQSETWHRRLHDSLRAAASAERLATMNRGPVRVEDMGGNVLWKAQ